MRGVQSEFHKPDRCALYSLSGTPDTQWRQNAMLLHGKDKPHPAVISTELEELLPEGSVMLKDWERPDHGDVQRDTVIEFLSVNTP